MTMMDGVMKTSDELEDEFWEALTKLHNAIKDEDFPEFKVPVYPEKIKPKHFMLMLEIAADCAGLMGRQIQEIDKILQENAMKKLEIGAGSGD